MALACKIHAGRHPFPARSIFQLNHTMEESPDPEIHPAAAPADGICSAGAFDYTTLPELLIIGNVGF